LVRDHAWNEFEIVKYKNKDGKIVIQPKEELFRQGLASPNCVDAAVLTMAVSDDSIRSNRIVRYRGANFHDAMDDVWNNG